VGIEIERKFLVAGDGWRADAEHVLIRQGYLSLSADGERTVRVRVKGDAGFITIKSKPDGLTRDEFEYAIPLADANDMLDRLCLRPLIEKVRHIVWHEGLRWEVDEFLNENAPLVMAEIELSDEAQAVPLPAWAGEEVTYDARYANSNLARKPFSTW
jgi:adenylate cyclase